MIAPVTKLDHKGNGDCMFHARTQETKPVGIYNTSIVRVITGGCRKGFRDQERMRISMKVGTMRWRLISMSLSAKPLISRPGTERRRFLLHRTGFVGLSANNNHQ